ncbi:MAG TPA: DUF4861 family protein [Bryobacteraceae bacterium]|nr:DUF4861 family protein [Bryobacteraceae bacterium]
MQIPKMLVWLAAAAAAPAAGAQGSPAADDWVLPNFAYRLNLEVSNPGSGPVRALATVPVVPAQAVAPNFPGRLAIAVLVNEGGRAPSVLPSQADDLDGDGFPDQFEFPVSLAPGERRRVQIYYSTTLHDEIYYPRRVQAKHNYGYNFQTVTLESELIGYRTYGAFFLDVQGRVAGHPGLHNDLVGYLSIRRDFEEGRDIFHVGETLGLGGIFLRREGQVYQPPFNVPDYAHKPQPEMAPHYRVISRGPLRAIVEAALERWTVAGDVFRLQARYSIDAGEGFVRCRFEAVPVNVAPGHVYELGIGVRDLPDESLRFFEGCLVVAGEQDKRTGPLGLAVYFAPADWEGPESVATRESGNRAAISRRRLGPGQAVEGDYAAAAAWSRSGIADLPGYLSGLKASVNARVGVSDFRFERTPRPEKLDAEAQ